MTNRKRFKYVPGLAVAAAVASVALTNGGCSSVAGVAGVASGCDEFQSGGVASLSIDVKTKAFVQASADLVAVSDSLENAVLTACAGIDTDLGVTDTWTALGSVDLKVGEACKQAHDKIKAILDAQAMVQATCTLAVTGGGCQVDVSAEADCTAKCSGDASCTPPDIMVACEPGQLSVQCNGTCNASATCEGSAMVAAQCQGTCEADCEGTCTPGTAPSVHCEGTCMGHCSGTCDGTATPAGGMAKCAGLCSGKCDAACVYTPGTPARCDGSCTGTCTGNCKLDANANIMCGANVSCKGGCTGMATAPKCEGEVTPPMCNADVNCKGSCQGHAEATAHCDPPAATLECSGTASADAQVHNLIATVQKNLPAIVAAVQTQGAIAAKAAAHVVTTGTAVVASVGSIGGKAIACAATAASASLKASASIKVSVDASASVSGSCGGPQPGA